MTHFSDDISSLWGPGGEHAADPKPTPLVRSPERPPEPPPEPVSPEVAAAPPVDPDRLAQLEARISALAESLDAHRSALDAALADQEARAAGNVELAALEGRMKTDLERMAAWAEAQHGLFLSRAEMKKLWDAMKESLEANLIQVRADAMAAAAADLAVLRADIGSRLAVVEERLTMLRQETPDRSR